MERDCVVEKVMRYLKNIGVFEEIVKIIDSWQDQHEHSSVLYSWMTLTVGKFTNN